MITSVEELDEVRGIDLGDVIVIDTETTGLDPEKDEVLSLSIVDGNGNVMFDDLIRPLHRKRWPKATEINGITWPDVKEKPSLSERVDEIRDIVGKSRLVVGYNISFDISMLAVSGLMLDVPAEFDVMKEYSRTRPYGKYAKLVECAAAYDYKFTAHDSTSDALATLHCFKSLLDDDKYRSAIEAEIERKAEAERVEKARIEENRKRESRRIAYKIAGVASIILSFVIVLNSCSAHSVGGWLFAIVSAFIMVFVGMLLIVIP